MYERSVLSNGARILTSSLPDTRSVSVGIFVGAGSRYESDLLAGASHFLEHMLFKGTERRPEAAMISGAIESVGGIINASTDREATVYWAKVAQQHFDLAIDLLIDMALYSTMPVEEVQRERLVILEELAMTNDQPDARVDLLIDEALWPGHPMGRDIGGSKDSVSGLTRSNLVDYHGQQYLANNIVVSVAGNVDHNHVVETVEQRLGGWVSGMLPKWLPVETTVGSEPTVSLEQRKTDQAHISLAFPGLSLHDHRRYALDLLNTILGEGMTSRLFMELRERQGLAYDVHSSSFHYNDCGAVVVYCGVDPRRAEAAVSSILGELARLKTDLSEKELQHAKAFATGRLLLRMEDTRSVMSSLGGQELLAGRVLTPDQVVENLQSVTLGQVEEVVHDLVIPEFYRLALVGPFRSDTRFQRLMTV